MEVEVEVSGGAVVGLEDWRLPVAILLAALLVSSSRLASEWGSVTHTHTHTHSSLNFLIPTLTPTFHLLCCLNGRVRVIHVSR